MTTKTEPLPSPSRPATITTFDALMKERYMDPWVKRSPKQEATAKGVQMTPQHPEYDPYTAHRLTRSDETARELTDARPANVEARKRLVAALLSDLDRPAPVRFPHVGRNFALEKKP